MNNVNSINQCTGCTLCVASCPRNAIRMIQNKKGFYVPQVEEARCIDCGVCIRNCILNNPTKGDRNSYKTYYQYSKNQSVQKGSTSGAAFYLIAKRIIEQGGIVCGVVWDDEYVAKHIVTSKIEDVMRMRGSKYVQSDLGECFKTIKSELIKGKKVLFSGTGCQTTGLMKFVGEELGRNLYCIALICGGVPSPKVWRTYKTALEKKYNSRIADLNMRSKNNGWYIPEIYVKFENGKKIQENLLQGNLYGTNFNEGLFINDECMECKFKLDTVSTDLIIADHWGINKTMLNQSKNLGASCIIALSSKGQDLVDMVSEESVIENGDLDNVIQSHAVLTKNHKSNDNREEFFTTYNADNILDILTHYYKTWERKIHRSPIIPFLYKIKLYNKVYMLKWKMTHK